MFAPGTPDHFSQLSINQANKIKKDISKQIIVIINLQKENSNVHHNFFLQLKASQGKARLI